MLEHLAVAHDLKVPDIAVIRDVASGNDLAINVEPRTAVDIDAPVTATDVADLAL